MKSAYTRYRDSILRQIRNQKSLGLDLNIELPLTERQLRQQGVQGADLRKETIRLRQTLPELKGITAETRYVSRETYRAMAIQQGHTNVGVAEDYIHHPRFAKLPENKVKTARHLTLEQRQHLSELAKQRWSEMSDEERTYRLAKLHRLNEGKTKKQLESSKKNLAKAQKKPRTKAQIEASRKNIQKAQEQRRKNREAQQQIEETIEQPTIEPDVETEAPDWQAPRTRQQTPEEIEINKRISSDYVDQETADEDLLYFTRFAEWFAGFSQPLPDAPQFQNSINYQGMILGIIGELVSEVGEAEIGRRLYENLGEEGLSECTETIQDPSASPNEKNMCSNRLMEALLDRDMTAEENEALAYQNEMLMYENMPSL